MALPIGLAVASGLLYFLSFPGPGLWPLGLVALVPLLVAVRGQPPRRALLLGWASGFTTTIAGFWWLLEMLRKYSGFPTAVCIGFLALLSLYQGGRMAVSTWLHARAVRNGWRSDTAFVVGFTGTEAVFPLLFPWYFGAVLHPVPVVIQVADLGGPILVSVVLVLVNLAVARIVLQLAAKRLPPAADFARPMIPIVLCVGYGAWRIHTVDLTAAVAPRLLVGVVQGNVPMEIAGAAAYREAFQRQVSLSEQLAQRGVSLIVWSESAFLYSVDTDQLEAELGTALRDQLRVPHLLGAIVEQPAPGRPNAFNSALMVTQGGKVLGRYDKRFLLPFGEYIPFGDVFPKLYALSPESGRITPGSTWAPLPFEDKRVTALICYEDIVPAFVNEAVERGRPHLLVNLTNDAWFGDTWEPWMHHALARFRAVEHHRYLVRATNTGVSSIIDPVGRELGHTGTFVAATMTGEVRWMYSTTVYEILGDRPWQIAALLALALAFLRRPASWAFFAPRALSKAGPKHRAE